MPPPIEQSHHHHHHHHPPPHPRPAPLAPTIVTVTLVGYAPHHPFFPPHLGRLTMLQYSVQVTHPDHTVVASTSLATSLNGAAHVVTDLAAGFTCAVGDAFSVVATDTGTNGIVGAPSAPFTGTGAVPVTPVGPLAPTITGVTYVSGS